MTRFYKDVLICSFGGFQFGYATSIIAGALAFVGATFSLSPLQQGIAASIALLGALITSAFASSWRSRWGGKATMQIGGIFFLVGSLLAACAWNYESLLLGRLITGAGAGIMPLLVPLYLIEIAPAPQRGYIVSSYQIAIALGSLSSYFAGYWFSSTGNWSFMFGMGTFIALGHLIALFFLDEKLPPQRLLAKNSWKQVFSPGFRPRLWLGISLAVFQQFTGISVAYYFAPEIFQEAGFSSLSSAMLVTFITGTVNLLAILLAFWLIDKVGRRPLLLTSLSGMVLGLLGLILAVLSHSPLLSSISLLAFIAAYAIGIGPIPSLFMGEITPSPIRGQAMAFTGFIGWIANYLVALTFLPLSAKLTSAGVFFIYSLFGLIALWIVATRIPETKGKTVEELSYEVFR
ncbi:MAG: MFS transporter [Verrucomicrobiota bacterium]|nr:MFS transporter [Verrucomicrobiota bacterium]